MMRCKWYRSALVYMCTCVRMLQWSHRSSRRISEVALTVCVCCDDGRTAACNPSTYVYNVRAYCDVGCQRSLRFISGSAFAMCAHIAMTVAPQLAIDVSAILNLQCARMLQRRLRPALRCSDSALQCAHMLRRQSHCSLRRIIDFAFTMRARGAITVTL